MDYEARSDSSGYVEQYCWLPWIRSYFNFINIFLFRNKLKFWNNGEFIAICDKLSSKDSDVRISFAVCVHSEFVSHALHLCILQFCLLDRITSKISLSHGKVREKVIIVITCLEVPPVCQLWMLHRVSRGFHPSAKHHNVMLCLIWTWLIFFSLISIISQNRGHFHLPL